MSKQQDIPQSDNELSAVHYIAQLINAQEAQRAGYSAPTRWLTLRDDLKAKYLKHAEMLVRGFVDEEMEMKRRRGEISYRTK